MIEAELLTEIRRLRDEVNELKARSFPPEFRMGMGDFGVRGIAWLDSGYRPFEVGSGGVLRPVTATHWYEPKAGGDDVIVQSTTSTLMWQTEFVTSGPEVTSSFYTYASSDAGEGRLVINCLQTGYVSNELVVPADSTWRRVLFGTSFPGISQVDPVTLQVRGRTTAGGTASIGVSRPTPLVNGGYLSDFQGMVLG